MQKTLIIGLCLLVSFLTSEAQKAPTAQLLIKEIINLRDSFVSHKFDEESTLKSNPVWSTKVYDSPEPPMVSEEITQIVYHQTKEVYKIQYPKFTEFQKKNIDVKLSYNPKEGICRVMLSDIGEGSEEIKKIIDFVERNAKKISETDYLYSGNYFRINEYTNPFSKNLKITPANKYPQGFEDEILVP